MQASTRAPDPTVHRSKSYKGHRPTTLAREVGSATISLRQNAVDRLSREHDEDDEDEQTGPTSNGKTKEHQRGYSDSHSYAGPSRLALASPPIAFFRQRANSLDQPVQDSETHHKPFYLPHYSTDSQYSLERRDAALSNRPGDESRTCDSSSPRRVIELGLGNDFDQTFGEAMRKGAGSQEINLPREALRALSEVKGSMDTRVRSKQGRKGSIGMGLFKESRTAVTERRKKREELVVEEEEKEDPTTPRKQSALSVPKTSPPRPEIANPPAVTPRAIERRPEQSWRSPGESAGSFSLNSDTSITASSSSSSSSSEADDEDQLDPTDVDSDEEERMTVPLQPFSHAVGGHSSIYKFTRRLVCKVRSDTRTPLICSLSSAEKTYSMKK